MKLRKILNEILDERLNYEFHLSTEPDLKEDLPMSKQKRSSSSDNERGNMGTDEDNQIYSTDEPENWFDQFEMELGEWEPDSIPRNLYIVNVKEPSNGGSLSQAINRPEDVTVVKKVPISGDRPNFNLGRQILKKIKGN